ncbi:MAG: DNA-methyltransferase Dcm [Candidatus Taylorbacteria bacterium]|nr:DNA-methyltransferase Dcm [Candidatus Taylorbacteria bacterium]
MAQNGAMSKFRYVDLFSGIGGFRIALDALGGQSHGYSEIDRYALQTYKINFNDPDHHDLGDVTKISKLGQLDVLVGGVPCQSWSVAGKRRGFEDPRGKLWFDTINMVRLSNPKVFVFENVKGLADPRNIENLELIKESFEELGYIVFHKILNTYDFGCPQNRSRVFIVGFRKDMKKFAQDFKYPTSEAYNFQLADFLDDIERKNIIKKKFSSTVLFDGKVPLSRNIFQKDDEFNDFFVLCDTRNGHTTIHSWDIRKTTKREKAICEAIMRNRRKSKYGDQDGNPLSFKDIQKLVGDATKKDIDSLVDKKILRHTENGKIDLVHSKNSSGIDGIYRVYLPNSSIFSTLTATGTRDYIATEYVEGETLEEYRLNFISSILTKKKLRQVTPKEAARIQGFPKDFKIHPNHTHAHKQFGNSVSPPVVKALMKKIIATGVLR